MTGCGRTLPRHRKRLPLRELALGACFLAAACAARAEECPTGNLLPTARVTGAGLRGHPRAVADQYLAAEGTRWDSPLAVVLSDPAARLDVDLGTARLVTVLLIQADGDDSYPIEGSLDNVAFFPIWIVPPWSGGGLRSRGIERAGVSVRYLRARGAGGDGNYSISELAVMCRAPGEGSHHGAVAASAQKVWLSYPDVLAVKLTVALLGLGLFLLGWLLRRRGTPGAFGRARDGALMALGIASVLCWWNLGAFHYANYLHPGELFHHFLGSKYFEETGYDGLYRCVAVADAEAGLDPWARSRTFRDLATKKQLVSGASLLEDPDACKTHFSPGRWREFVLDLAWFRTWIPPLIWERTMQDHGYNASPAWGLVGSLLTRNLPAADPGVLALALLDPLLLLIMWALLLWVFGWRAAAVAALWWGTNLPADFSWTGGGFLRQDWLVLSVAGVCLVRRHRWASGGAVLASATLLRAYPGFLVAGLACKALAGMVQRRSFSLEKGHRRFAAGFLAASALIVLLSSAANPRGGAAWSGFLQNGQALLSTSATNNLGLKALLSYDPGSLPRTGGGVAFGDQLSDWHKEKTRVLHTRRWLWLAVNLVFVGLLLRRVRDVQDWEALVLGAGLIALVVSSSSYYASILLLYGTLWEHREETVAVPLCALAAWTQLAMLFWGQQQEELFTWVSLGLVVTVVLITALRKPETRAGRGKATPRDSSTLAGGAW